MKKKIFSLAAVIMLFSATGMAQDQDQKQGRPDRSQGIEQMITELGLDETQAAQFKEVMAEMMPQDMGEQAPRGPMGPRGPRGPRGPKGPRGEMSENAPQPNDSVAPPCACAQPTEDVAAPQCACAQPGDDNAAPQCACGRPNPEQMKAMKEDMEAKKAEMEAKKAEMDEKIKAILTDEQYQKFQEMTAQRPERPQGPRSPRGPRGPKPQPQETTTE
ncbi:MAG: hypothetical protein LUD48_01575 [Prevotella sp.]|nr:hypothetical protein [Prevotella sp.]